eukprot:gnl/Trimastix_PCT/3114.p1 GENE.gnl/Trimastix_PCT/3114~~gnl/Trimastix_PCT/3114.p1  ORF type:complete len:468 (+),score=94.55 gnl/Trimastix_PCT/3114:53-1456(+)
MKYIAAFLLSLLGRGSAPSREDVVEILSAGGIAADDECLSLVMNQLQGSNVDQIIELGRSLLCSKSPGRTELSLPPVHIPQCPFNLFMQFKEALNQFSAHLFTTIAQTQGHESLFLSPMSIFLVLGMTANGAACDTLDEMRAALHLGPMSLQDTNRAILSLLMSIQHESVTHGVTCELASSIWVNPQASANILPEFKTVLSTQYQSDVFPLPESPGPVNQWIASKTHHRITDMLDSLSADTVMLLINAVYFHGSWQDEFDPRLTERDWFHPLGDGPLQPVQLMMRHGCMAYRETDDYQLCDLPYGRTGEYKMTILLPKDGRALDCVMRELPVNIMTWDKRASEGTLHLPRFRVSWGPESCSAALQALGMHHAFDPICARFGRMVDLSRTTKNVYISNVLHKAFVEVTERGTEAAAATVVEMAEEEAEDDWDDPYVPWVMKCDRPFLVAIRKGPLILFLGRVSSVEGM